jgi:hypothetical protein
VGAQQVTACHQVIGCGSDVRGEQAVIGAGHEVLEGVPGNGQVLGRRP